LRISRASDTFSKPVDAKRTFLENVDLIRQIARFVAQRHNLSREDAEELASTVMLKIVESDYEVVRKFEGRSTLRTYLTTIIQRVFLDERTARWGKWRPSAQARRLGPAAILFDQLVTRDGVAVTDAVAEVRNRYTDAPSIDQLRDLAATLPRRMSRQFVSDDHLDDVPASGSSSPLDERVEHDEVRRVEDALAAALQQISVEERVILTMRFQHDLSIAQIARLTGLEEKQLYYRLSAIMKVLRRELEARGVTRQEIVALVGAPAAQFEPIIEAGLVEKRVESPSQ
jgi:RNA polymerase sigma factor (sigma-70 family)